MLRKGSVLFRFATPFLYFVSRIVCLSQPRWIFLPSLAELHVGSAGPAFPGCRPDGPPLASGKGSPGVLFLNNKSAIAVAHTGRRHADVTVVLCPSVRSKRSGRSGSVASAAKKKN